MSDNYRVVNIDEYYRKDIYRHFTEDCKCSASVTSRLDVTKLVEYSKQSGSKFYINFIYLIAKVLNSREEYRMQYDYTKEELIVFDQVNPSHCIFNAETELYSLVYSEYNEDYKKFYQNCLVDIEHAKARNSYGLDLTKRNYFDTSYLSWLSYDSLHVELPDGYLHFLPIIHWGRYTQDGDRLTMPVTVRMNHASVDGYLIAKVFLLLEKEIIAFTQS